MKKFLFIVSLIMSFLNASGQAYLGNTTNSVNLRSAPSTESNVIRKLPKNADIFLVSTDEENQFYNVIYILTNEEGYVHKDFIKIGKLVQRSTENVFTPAGRSEKYDPDVEIFNNTSKTLTLRLNKTIYSFKPNEKRTLTISPGPYDFMASAPGVQPYLGSENISSSTNYSWAFYIVTSNW